jgi:hypothetical protein
MIRQSKHTEYTVSEKGIVILSRLSTDIPFIIQCNPAFGIVIRLADDTINLTYDMDWHLLDINSMILYHGIVQDHSRWILVIPAIGKKLSPADSFEIKQLYSHKIFSKQDFPSGFQKFENLAVIIGFPE